MLLRRGQCFAFIRFDNDLFVILYTKDIFLAPAFELDHKNTLPWHKDANVKLSTKDLVVPVNYICIVKILYCLSNKKIFSKIIGAT